MKTNMGIRVAIAVACAFLGAFFSKGAQACPHCPTGRVQTDCYGSDTWKNMQNGEFVCGSYAFIQSGYNFSAGEYFIEVAPHNGNVGCIDAAGQEDGVTNGTCFVECVTSVDHGGCTFAEEISPDCTNPDTGVGPVSHVAYDVESCT